MHLYPNLALDYNFIDSSKPPELTGDFKEQASLTLGANAQRGLLYLVCVCVCVCLHLFSPYRDQAGSLAIPKAIAQQGLENVCGDFA